MNSTADSTVTNPGVYARRWWTLAVLCLSLLVIGLDNTILNVALPTLVRDLHASQSQLQWIVDAYTIVFASLLLTAGSLGDRFGRKRALSVGLVLFGAGSAFAAFSGSASLLILARGAAGVGGALIMPATLSILTNVFPAEERGRAIGIWAGMSAIGIVAGPTAGGWLLQHFWWGSVFLINVPVVAAALVAGHFLVPESRDPAARRLDPNGTVLSAVGLVGLLYGIIEAPTHGWQDPAVLAAFAVAALFLSAFVVWELRTDHPMLDVRFFDNARFSAASVSITLVFFAMFGVLFFLTQYLQVVLGYSAFKAGLSFLPVAVAMMIAAPNSARLTARFGTKVVVTAGMVIVAGSLVLLSGATVSSGYALVATVLGLLGLGMAIAMAPATESIMGSLPPERAGVGSAVNDTTREVGGALGVAVLGSLTNAAYRAHMGSSAAAAALPPAARAAVRAGVGNAVAVAQQLPGRAGVALAADARVAFVHAMSSTVRVGAVVALAGAVVAALWLPAHGATPATARPLDEFDPEVATVGGLDLAVASE